MREANAVLDRAISAAERVPCDRTLLSIALRSRGVAQRRRGNSAASRIDLENAIRLARAIGHRDLEGTILCAQARVEGAAGPDQAAAACLDRALELAAEIDSRQLRAEALTNRAVLDRQNRNFAAAMTVLDQVLPEARQLGDRSMEGRILGNMCSIAIEQNMDIRVPELVRQAMAVYELVDNQRSRALLETHLSIHHAQRKDFHRARQCLESAIHVFRSMGDRAHEIVAMRTLGWMALRQHGPSEGLEHFDEAMRLLPEDDVTATDGYVQAARGVVLATRGELALADDAFSAARAAAEQSIHPADILIVLTCLGHLELARARRAREVGRSDVADELIEAARQRLEHAKDHPITRSETQVGLRLGIDASIRLLRDALTSHTATSARSERRIARGSTPPAEAPPDVALVVGDGAGWFRPPRGQLVDLQRRKPMRSILSELVRRRLSTPGEALAVEALVDIGWPGERVLPSAGASRVHVAIGSLRKLGLRDVLLRDKNGYLLDPEVPLLDGYEQTTILARVPTA